MMKSLLITLVCLVTTLVSGSAQSDTEPTIEQIREARKTIEFIERDILRSASDMQAAALILEDKTADERANLYLIEVEGYEEAVANNTLLEFQKQVKSDDKAYRKLYKAAAKTQTAKEEYIASVNPNYQEALELYKEAVN